MLKDSKILILGATGLVGSAVVRQLEKQGYDNLLTPSSNDVDLLDEDQVFVSDGDIYLLPLCDTCKGKKEAGNLSDSKE